MTLIKTVRLILLSALVACTKPTPPRIVMPHVRLTGTVEPFMLDGARGWTPLGFTFSTEDTGLPVCARYWYRAGGSRHCQLEIFILRDPALIERRGTDAMANRDSRVITLDARLIDRDALRIAAAHEVGHIVIDTPTHTKGGIMGGASRYMNATDRALACTSIGICLGGDS